MRNNVTLPTTRASLPMKPMRRAAATRMFGALVCCGLLVVAGRAQAAEYYVSPTGSDSAAGSMAAPFASIQKANDSAAAGDTVWLRAGTYYSTPQITMTKSGQSDTQRIKYWAYQNEVPVLDCSKYRTTNAAVDVPCILVTGSWLHFRGIEVANGPVGASGTHSIDMIRVKGASNDIFELMNIHHGFGPGLFFDGGTGGHLILNCDSHDNYDKNGSQGDGQNGDGFGVHYQMTGPSTTIRGCRSWVDSDDGYDLIGQEVSVIVENSFAIQNGYSDGGAGKPSSGNGNGFKMGSSQVAGARHIVRNNVAWKNRAAGFYANHSGGGNTWYNNTSYMNSTQYDMLASSFNSSGGVTGTIILSGSKAHIMRNNIGFPNKNSNMTGVDSMFNTWDLNIAEAATDFVSTSDTGCTGPREADGSIPAACTFLKLKAGSPLIDKGTNVMLPFVGAAPDLGAYEYGATTTTSGTSGGETGAGGASGTGGGGVAGAAGDSGTGGGAAGGETGSGGSGLGGSPIEGSGGSSAAGTGGSLAGSSGSTVSGSGGQSAGAGGTGEVTPTGSSNSGCSCAITSGGTSRDENATAGSFALALAFAAIPLARSRRRKTARPS